MKLSEIIRGCSEGPGDFEDWAEQAAQLEEENEALKEWRKQAITAFEDIDHEACIDYLDALLTKETNDED